MSKTPSAKLKAIINYLSEASATLLYLPTSVEDEFDQVLLLGEGKLIWLAEKDAPEVPMLNIDELSDDTELLFELFNAREEEKLDAKKLYSFEDKLRKALKEASDKMSPEEVREVRIAFMDTKEQVLA